MMQTKTQYQMRVRKDLEALKGYEIISIILIHEDNREQLGEDFDWEDVA